MTVKYAAEVVERTGLIKILSPGLIQSSAKSVIEDTWKSIEARLNAERGGGNAEPKPE